MMDCLKCSVKHLSVSEVLFEEGLETDDQNKTKKKLIKCMAHLSLSENHLTANHQMIAIKIRLYRKSIEDYVFEGFKIPQSRFKELIEDILKLEPKNNLPSKTLV